MADFCSQCSIELFGEDFKDLANLGNGKPLRENFGWMAICEGCGHTVVDNDGKCVAKWCDKKHRKEPPHTETVINND
jgi:hypothetical protein